MNGCGVRGETLGGCCQKLTPGNSLGKEEKTEHQCHRRNLEWILLGSVKVLRSELRSSLGKKEQTEYQ